MSLIVEMGRFSAQDKSTAELAELVEQVLRKVNVSTEYEMPFIFTREEALFVGHSVLAQLSMRKLLEER